LKRSLNRVLDVRNLCTSLPVSRKHLLLHVLPSPQTQSGIPSRKPQTRPEKPKTHKTVKRSPIIAHRSHGKLERRHTDGLIHRTKPNRPHISSRYNSFKERETKTNRTAVSYSASARQSLKVFSALPRSASLPNPFRVPSQHLSASVRRYLRMALQDRKSFFHPDPHFFATPHSVAKIWGLADGSLLLTA